MPGFLSLALAYLGFVALALAMPRHFAQLLGGKPAPWAPVVFRALGWALLALSLWPAVALWRLGVGISAWLGLLSVAAFCVGMSLSLIETAWPRWVMAVPLALAVLGAGFVAALG